MALPGATLADGVVDTRGDALVRHRPVSQMWRRASGYRNVGILLRPGSWPRWPSRACSKSTTRHTGAGLGCRPRSEFTSPGTAPACSRPGPRSRFVPQASGDHVFTGCVVPPIPSLSSKTHSCIMSPSTRETLHTWARDRGMVPPSPTPPAGETGRPVADGHRTTRPGAAMATHPRTWRPPPRSAAPVFHSVPRSSRPLHRRAGDAARGPHRPRGRRHPAGRAQPALPGGLARRAGIGPHRPKYPHPQASPTGLARLRQPPASQR